LVTFGPGFPSEVSRAGVDWSKPDVLSCGLPGLRSVPREK